jgi:preprotein translocase subunit SecD
MRLFYYGIRKEGLIMTKLHKNWRVLLAGVLIVFAIGLLFFKGLEFGVDFNGGTEFQLQLAEPLHDAQQTQKLVSTIEKRLDWTGLKDTTVVALGSATEGVEFIEARIAETDAKAVEKLESILLRQGKFEVFIQGEEMFTGEEIVSVITNPAQGYGFRRVGNSETFEWLMPFSLTQEGAKQFTKTAFHQCRPVGFTGEGQSQYDCAQSYFFIDRPSKSIIVIDEDLYAQDEQRLLQGSVLEGFPQGTAITELITNTGVPVIVYKGTLTTEQEEEVLGYLQKYSSVIIPETTQKIVEDQLTAIGFTIKKEALPSTIPWLWRISGAKTVITLTEQITNDNPYVENFENAEVFSSLIIRGAANSSEEAQQELDNLVILLQSGSLPVAIADVSKQTISPLLGQEFLTTTWLIGVVALLLVGLVLFIRYRIPKLIVPIILTGLSEVILVLGFASLINWNLDLASVAGILAAVGTGVDDQIVITDEILKGGLLLHSSIVARVKSAFFIIFAAAATSLATMMPIIFFGIGLGKLMGFAITTIAGVLIGVLITRPAFGEILKEILAAKQE